MAFTWCFITSSPTPLVESSCLLNSISCLHNLYLHLLHMRAQSLKLCVQIGVDRINLPIEVHVHSLMCLKNPIEHLFNLALLSRRRWLLVVGTSKIYVVSVAVVIGFLVLRILVEVTPIFIGVFVSTLVSLESSSTNVVYFFFLWSTLYSFCIFNKANLLLEKLVNTVQFCLHLIHLIISKDGGRSLPLKISVLGDITRC
ncbi:unnamed protein product [Brassica oleracea]